MRKTTKIYKDIPSGYPLCLHGDCPMAASCLRQLAYRRHEELGTFLNLINPSKCSQQADCPHYVSNQPVRFAKGFTNFQKRMYPYQYDNRWSLTNTSTPSTGYLKISQTYQPNIKVMFNQVNQH